MASEGENLSYYVSWIWDHGRGVVTLSLAQCKSVKVVITHFSGLISAVT